MELLIHEVLRGEAGQGLLSARMGAGVLLLQELFEGFISE
jgi:hypothetical protein